MSQGGLHLARSEPGCCCCGCEIGARPSAIAIVVASLRLGRLSVTRPHQQRQHSSRTVCLPSADNEYLTPPVPLPIPNTRTSAVLVTLLCFIRARISVSTFYAFLCFALLCFAFVSFRFVSFRGTIGETSTYASPSPLLPFTRSLYAAVLFFLTRLPFRILRRLSIRIHFFRFDSFFASFVGFFSLAGFHSKKSARRVRAKSDELVDQDYE